MQISPAFEPRDYPETWLTSSMENEPELMASVFLKASTGNNYDLIEPDPNPELVPKSF